MTVRRMLWGGALLAGAVAIGHAALRTERGRELDEELFAAANADHGASLDRSLAAVTELGSLYAAGAATGALAVTGRARLAVRALAAAGTTWLIGQGLKRGVTRPRPYDADPDATRKLIASPQGTSWPSSHPAVLTTFTRVAGRELGLRAPARAALRGLDLVVAASRVALGVHYPSDVVSGLLIGRAVATLWPRGPRR